jgi:hypothetical protein
MLRVKSIHISRFRGIREGEVKDFADVNLLIGRNNCGKSTVVEAIYRVGYSVANGRDPLGRDIEVWSGSRGESMGSPPPSLWYRLDQNEAIELSIEVGKPHSKDALPVFQRMAMQGGRLLSKGSFVKPTNWGNVNYAIWEDKAHRVAEPEILPFLGSATLFRPEDGRNSTIERTLWEKITGQRNDKRLRQSLNTVFNEEAEEYQLHPDGRLRVLYPEYAVPVDSQGEGYRAAVRCLVFLTLLRRTFLIAEELECHQHPGSLERLAKALCKQAKEQEVQLFLTTHSSVCVRTFLAGAREAGSEAAVIHLKLDDGKLDATRLSPDATESLFDTDIDVRFLDLYG